MINGEKPYQVYSITGGDSYIFETGASAGWTKEELEANDCFSVFIDFSFVLRAECPTHS